VVGAAAAVTVLLLVQHDNTNNNTNNKNVVVDGTKNRMVVVDNVSIGSVGKNKKDGGFLGVCLCVSVPLCVCLSN